MKRKRSTAAADFCWAALRWLYASWFIFFGLFMILGFGGHLPGSVGSQPNAFLLALNRAGFVEPLLIMAYALGGSALYFRRTAPLGIVLLAGPVTVIFLFHLFDTHLYLWGSIWPIGLGALAWRFRDGLAPLWTFGLVRSGDLRV